MVGSVDGVRLSGILMQAGPYKSNSLLVWGTKGYRGNYYNPGILQDVFARVGGTNDPNGSLEKLNCL